MIIPAIDLINEKLVSLRQGEDKVIELDNPLDFARRFSGFPEIQVIDLDAAIGKGNNDKLVSEICKVARCRVGGGIRTIERAKELIAGGAEKIIIGTKANREFLSELIAEIGKDKIIVALDSRSGKVVVEGWKQKTDKRPIELAKELEDYCSEFLYTSIDKEGLMNGIDLETIKNLKNITKNKISYAGGVSTLEEINDLAKQGIDCVVGMAIYTGKLNLEGGKMDFKKLLSDSLNSLSLLRDEVSIGRNIKVVVKTGKNPGKNTVILAGVHGNEICGIRALDNIIPKINIEFGKITFIYANLEAIKQNKRFIEKNLNRCFFKKQPAEIEGTLEGRTAKEIMPYLDSADLLLDVHASYIKDSTPFVICDKKNVKTAEIFNGEIVSYNWDPFEQGSTDYYMNLQGKPGFCIECGYLGDSETQRIAENAITNFLIYSGNIIGDLLLRKDQRIIRIKSLYKNTEEKFKITRYFPDFEKFVERTLIGKEGNREVYADAGDIILFAQDNEKIGEECFLLGEETLLNNTKLGE